MIKIYCLVLLYIDNFSECLQLLGCMDLRVVCTNIATPTDLLSINELEHGNFDTGM